MKMNFILSLTLFVFSFLGSTFLLFGYAYINTVTSGISRGIIYDSYGVICMTNFILIFSIICIISAIFTIIYTFDGKVNDRGDKEFMRKFFRNKIFLCTCIVGLLPSLYFLFILILIIFNVEPFYDFRTIDKVAKWIFVVYFLIGIPIFFILLKRNRKKIGMMQ